MSRKVLIAMLVAALATSLFAASPVEAKKKKKKAKPVVHTLFLEGENPVGEADERLLPHDALGNAYLKLQPTEGSGEKSMGLPNYVAGPNVNCAGSLLLPSFLGSVSGRIVGDMKISFPVNAPAGGTVELRVWPDVTAQSCNETYPTPAGAVEVDLPSGEGMVEAVIEGVDFAPAANLMFQITPVIGGSPSYSRVYYGTADSKIEFGCLPAAGAASCVAAE